MKLTVMVDLIGQRGHTTYETGSVLMVRTDVELVEVGAHKAEELSPADVDAIEERVSAALRRVAAEAENEIGRLAKLADERARHAREAVKVTV
jgi:ribosomal protein S19E (S16A)